MNAVLEACVHCGDTDAALKVFDEMSKPESCGVDTVSYATLLKEIYAELTVFLHDMVLSFMKGYISTGCPQGLRPDKLTYDTLIFACVKAKNMVAAMQFFEEMKEEADEYNRDDLFPEIVTYTKLLMGLEHAKDINSILIIVMEMKLCHYSFVDHVLFVYLEKY
ncbi:Pentatricopeptide repeat [Dillenia turbinata]|uniref:Pentatricopeptide repeat n=1 Tax=Dillenia turbinata TaxID=194707 RepID=A0AAN8UJR6_9MAGN